MRNKPVNRAPPCSLHQLLPLCSYHIEVSVLTFFHDEQCCESVSQIHPFLKLSLIMVFHWSNSNPEEDRFQSSFASTTSILHHAGCLLSYIILQVREFESEGCYYVLPSSKHHPKALHAGRDPDAESWPWLLICLLILSTVTIRWVIPYKNLAR